MIQFSKLCLNLGVMKGLFKSFPWTVNTLKKIEKLGFTYFTNSVEMIYKGHVSQFHERWVLINSLSISFKLSANSRKKIS